MNYQFDPELALIVPSLPYYDVSDIAIARQRRLADRAVQPPFVMPDTLRVTNFVVPGPPGDPDVEVCLFRRVDLTDPAPCLLWMHGGGFVYGEVANDLTAPAEIAETVGAVVISVEYRLAPEHPFPAGVEDCYAVLRWIHDRSGELGVDRNRLAVGGQSAGGGLAAAVALLARDRDGPDLCFQMLDIPVLDDRLATQSMRTYVDTPVWDRANAEASWAAYLGGSGGDDTSPYAAPARAVDLAGLPSAYVITCEFDPLRDEGIEYAQRLLQAGVATELRNYPGTFHGSMGSAPQTEISRRMVADRLDALARALSGRDS